MKADRRAKELIEILRDDEMSLKKKALYVMRLVEGITDHYPPDNITKVYYKEMKKHIQAELDPHMGHTMHEIDKKDKDLNTSGTQTSSKLEYKEGKPDEEE